MKKLQVTSQDALKAYKKGNKSEKRLLETLFGKEVFIESVTDKIKTFEDVLGYHKLDIKKFTKEHKSLPSDVFAYLKLRLITAALNQGWEPDWNNQGEYKYLPWFNIGSSGSGFSCGDCGGWSTGADVGSRLCFKSSELAKYAGEQFTDVYKQYMLIK